MSLARSRRTPKAIGSGGRSSSFTTVFSNSSTAAIPAPFTTSHCRSPGGRIRASIRSKVRSSRFLKQRMGDSDFGFKDPRTVRLMPLWHQIFNDLKLAPKIVLCLRNPAQVARSLNSRDGIDVDIGEYRWLVHMADFFRYSGSFDVCTVEYEEWFTDPLANFEKLRTFLDLRMAAKRSRSRLGPFRNYRPGSKTRQPRSYGRYPPAGALALQVEGYLRRSPVRRAHRHRFAICHIPTAAGAISKSLRTRSRHCRESSSAGAGTAALRSAVEEGDAEAERLAIASTSWHEDARMMRLRWQSHGRG